MPRDQKGTPFGSEMLVVLGFLPFGAFPCPPAAQLGCPPGFTLASAAASDLVFVTAPMAVVLAPECLFY